MTDFFMVLLKTSASHPIKNSAVIKLQFALTFINSFYSHITEFVS